jgi:predicted ATPase with chaperone activity
MSNAANLPSDQQGDVNIDAMLDRINRMAAGERVPANPAPMSTPPATTAPVQNSQPPLVTAPPPPVAFENTTADGEATFIPKEPQELADLKVSEAIIEEIAVKYLLSKGDASMRQISEQLGVPFAIIENLVTRLKNDQYLGYIDQAAMNDYVCRLTEKGRSLAKDYSGACTYFGTCPVSFEDYVASVEAQTINDQSPGQEDLDRAFSDLLIDPTMMIRLGPAVNSGRGMFLFGFPGNGKTSIAERITKAFGQYVWIPKSITMDRDIVRIFDPMNHEECPPEEGDDILETIRYDKRWVRIRRPTIVVGGELKMEHLELQYNAETGISEAPIQIKSNTGLLLIDDFGRQQMTVDELLNRWIVPLEKRYDFLNTSNGKKVQVPFDQLVVFSTNLEPKDLVDDAFLRRIPYKIEVPNPSVENFVKLFEIMCVKVFKIEYRPEIVKYLLEKHYMPTNRPLRNCHPRDLILQVQNYCKFLKRPFELSTEAIDFACENYFSIM